MLPQGLRSLHFRRGLLCAALSGISLLASCASTETSRSAIRGTRDLIQAGDRDFERRSYGRALESFRLGAFAAERAGEDALFVEAASQAASSLALQDLLPDARSWFVRAAERGDPDAPEAWTRLLLARGLLEWKEERGRDALSTFSELYHYCYLHSLTVRAIQAAQLATLVSEEGDQLEWARRAIEASRTTGDASLEAPQWANLGWLLEERGLHEDALPAFARFLELTVRSDATRLGRARAEWAYAHALRKAGRSAEAQERLDELLAVTTGLYVRDRRGGSAEYLGRTLMDLAELDRDAGRVARAAERYERARARLIEAGAAEAAPELLEELEERIETLR